MGGDLIKDDDGEKISAYLFAGFSVFLTLRLALHGSSFCLIRFQIPEHLFSLYVNRIHNAMQLGTLFGAAIGTGMAKAPSGDADTTNANGVHQPEDSGGHTHNTTDPGAKVYISIVVSWSLFFINVTILIAFVTGGKYGNITFFYWSMALSSVIFAINMQFILSMAKGNVVYYLAAENSTQILTSGLHWLLLLFYGNRRKHYTEFVVIVYQIVITILVTGVSAGLWTAVYKEKQISPKPQGGSEGPDWALALSPMAMCAIGLGMVFAFYPAIAPGMLVEFRLVHRVDMILLLVSPIPSVTIALLSVIGKKMAEAAGPGGTDWFAPHNPAKNKWDSLEGAAFWHFCHISTVTEIVCAILFNITLQYPKKWLSRSLRRPGWACLVSIIFYMSQEILAAVGYAGVEGNSGKGQQKDETPVIFNNLFIRLSMIILIFSIGGFNN